MTKRELKALFNEEVRPRRQEETRELCARLTETMPRSFGLGFFPFLSAVARHVGPRMWACQAAALALALGTIRGSGAQGAGAIAVFTPLFVLACLPALLQGRCCGMEEIEAAARSSGAQLALAKLLLALSADLVCLSLLIGLGAGRLLELRGLMALALYALVPLMFCTGLALRSLRRGGAVQAAVLACVAFSAGAGLAAAALPRLYEASMVGLWILGLCLALLFFGREAGLLLKMKKEGKVYGIGC